MRAFFIESGVEPVPYNREFHAKRVEKFLYWANNGNEILIAGPKVGGTSTHEDLREDAGSLAPEGMPDGAGNVLGGSGQIFGWNSHRYQIETPELIRPRIAEVLGLGILESAC